MAGWVAWGAGAGREARQAAGPSANGAFKLRCLALSLLFYVSSVFLLIRAMLHKVCWYLPF